MLRDDANLFMPHILGKLQLIAHNCVHDIRPGSDAGVRAEGSVVGADGGEGGGCSARDGGEEGEEQGGVMEDVEGHEEW